MGRATSKDNEAKSKMKQPSDIVTSSDMQVDLVRVGEF